MGETLGAILGGAIGGLPGASIGAGLFDSGGTKAAKAGDYRSAASGTIEGRVMGARRMGLHPLYALGASTPGPSQVIPGQSKLGSIAKDAAVMLSQAEQNKNIRAQTALLRAQAGTETVRQAAIIREMNSNPAPQGVGVTGAATPAAPIVPYTVEKGTQIKRTNPESAIGTDEVFGPMIDKAVLNPELRDDMAKDLWFQMKHILDSYLFPDKKRKWKSGYRGTGFRGRKLSENASRSGVIRR